MKKVIIRIVIVIFVIGAAMWVKEFHRQISGSRDFLRASPRYSEAKESYKKNPNKTWYLDYMYE